MSLWEAKGFWMRDNIHWPRPVHPLFVSYGLIPIEVGSARAFEEWSMPSLKYTYLVLHGYVFQRIEPLGGDTPPIMERFPFLFHLWRINPKLRSRILGFAQFLKEKGFENHVHAWKDIWEPEAQRRLEPIRNFDRANASLGELANHLDQCYDYLCWAWNPHNKVVMVGMYIRERWMEVCKRLLNLTEFEACELVVIIQEMAPHEVSGVVFTVNPLSNDSSELIINAIRGVGEALVQGEIIPDQWLARRPDGGVLDFSPAPQKGQLPSPFIRTQRPARGCLTSQQVRELACLCLRIEEHFDGVPQDIEWSYGLGEFYLLQSRPITTLKAY